MKPKTLTRQDIYNNKKAAKTIKKITETSPTNNLKGQFTIKFETHISIYSPNVLEIIPKQSRWINSATGKRKNTYFWFWGDTLRI